MIGITGTFAMAAVLFSAAVAPMLLAASAAETSHAGDGLAIVTPPEASALETLAAREVRRYVYLRTGELLPITTQETAPATGAIVIARKDRAPVAATAAIQAAAKDLGRSVYTVSLPPMAEDVEYYLSAETASDKKIVWPTTAPGLCQTVVVGPELR